MATPTKFLQRELLRVRRAELHHTTKIFEVRTCADRLDQWEVTFHYYDEEVERAGFDKVLLLIQFCTTDAQVPPKVSVIKPRLTGIGLFGGALCFDRQKMWGEFSTDMETFLLTMRLHLIYQVQARLEQPAPSSTSSLTSSSSSSSSSSSTSTSSLADSSFSPQERANGFSHIMRTHWDWELVDIADDGSAVALKRAEQQQMNRKEAEKLLQNALAHLQQTNNISAALQSITEAIALHPQRSELYFRRAMVFLKLESVALARHDLELAARRNPVYPGTKVMLEEIRKQIAEAPDTRRTLYVCSNKSKAVPPTAHVYRTLEDAMEEAQDGDTVAFTRGTYVVSGLLISKDVTLRAHPKRAKVRLSAAEGASAILEIWSNNAVLKGLTMQRQGPGSCIKIPNGHCTLRNCSLVGVGEHCMGLLIEGAHSCATVERSRLVCDEFAIVVRQKAECTLQQCAVTSTNGIIAETAATINVFKCRLRGPLVYTDFTSGRIEHNVVSNSKSLGMSFQGRTKEIMVSHNIIKDNQSVGVLACRGAQVRLQDNLLCQNGRTQIEVQGATQVTILNNGLENGRVNGILVTAQATTPVIEGNIIVAHQNAGISVCEGSTANIIGNTVHLCGASGLFFSGQSGGVVHNNTISQCCIAGLELEYLCNPTLKGNTITDCRAGVQAPLTVLPDIWRDTTLLRNMTNVNHYGSNPGPVEGNTMLVGNECGDQPQQLRRRLRYDQRLAGLILTSNGSQKRSSGALTDDEGVERRLTRQLAKTTIVGRYPKRQRTERRQLRPKD